MTTAITTIARGDGSGIVDEKQTVVRDPTAWRTLWALHAGPTAEAPVVDFDAHMIAAAFAGERPSPGYEVEIGRAAQDGPTLTLAVEERSPAPGMMAAQMIVTPFHIVTLPRHDGDVRFVKAGGVPPPPAGRREAETPIKPASSTGLAPNMAAALAYLAGPFSGVIILFAERTNSYVRFHAWQSILGLGGLGIFAVALLVASFLTLLVSPLAFTVMYRLSEVMSVLWLVAWGVCLVNAYAGHEWKMPLIGRYAERRAAV